MLELKFKNRKKNYGVLLKNIASCISKKKPIILSLLTLGRPSYLLYETN